MDIRDFLRAKAKELRDTASLHESVLPEMPKTLATPLASPAALGAEADGLEAIANEHVMRKSTVVASYRGPDWLICSVDHQTADPCNNLRKAAWRFRDDKDFDDAWTPNSALEAQTD